MDESGVHFKFLFGPIYLFAYFLPIYLWLCLRARKNSTFSQKRSGCVSSEDGCRTSLSTFPLCHLIYSNGRRKWTRVHPHGSYCHYISVESCRDYSGDGSIKDNQKTSWLFQVLALVCIFPASFGTFKGSFKLFKTAGIKEPAQGWLLTSYCLLKVHSIRSILHTYFIYWKSPKKGYIRLPCTALLGYRGGDFAACVNHSRY